MIERNIVIQYLVSVLISVLMLSCHDKEEPTPAGEGSLCFSFDLMTGELNTNTRNDDMSHTETESEYRQFEDAIDLNDLGVFLFAKVEGGDSEALLLKVTDFSSQSNTSIHLSGGPGSYRLNFDIERKELSKILDNIDITPDGTDNIVFRLLILANCSSPGTNAQAKWNSIEGKDYETVINELQDWTYAVAYIYNDNYSGEDITKLYTNKKRNCPMFGTCLYSVSQEALYESSPESRLMIGEIDMLRALAKVRVVDNIPKVDGYPRIVSATFYGTQSSARQLPFAAFSYINGSQVHTPNIVEPDRELKFEGAVSYRLGVIPDAWSITPTDQRTGATRIGYVPEQKIGDVYDDVVIGMPVFSIEIAHSKNEDGSENKSTYNVAMTGYKDHIFEFGNNILRNHIYTLSVDAIGETGPKVKVRVNPWVTERQHIELQ
ncbi:MAG: hypothetical protein K2H86_00240 [Muribaculaceae bacterium]|nr:hypothetical protein [Muribaculaceae bacterium]